MNLSIKQAIDDLVVNIGIYFQIRDDYQNLLSDEVSPEI